MDVSDVLQRLREKGVTLEAQGDRLRFFPEEAVGPDLLEQLKEHKGEIMAALEAEAALPDGARALLARLRAGAPWLLDHHRRWMDGSPGAAGDELFTKMLHLWADLDEQLRAAYAFKGCVLGSGQRCPDDAPVRCLNCAGIVVTETGEQRYA